MSMDPLDVQGFDFYARDNSREHHTERYDLVALRDKPTPIFRRGFSFIFTLRFNRNFDESRDIVYIAFCFGPKPHVTKGTKVILPLLTREKQMQKEMYRWNMTMQRHEGNAVTMQIHIPPNAQVGIWRCEIQTEIFGGRSYEAYRRGELYIDGRDNLKRDDFRCEEDMYILFNPWCRDDGVYMDREDDRQEYVLNDSGKIWCGTYKHPKGKRWIYGQFDEVILPAVLFLLDKSHLPYVDWGSPVLVSRAITQIVNAFDDEGLLEGKWDGDYRGGTSPHAWTGSIAILSQFLKSGGRPVKYGQCWVFSALVVTICRALGIPCRSTTNYVSAHDINCSLTVDRYFDSRGNRLEYGPRGETYRYKRVIPHNYQRLNDQERRIQRYDWSKDAEYQDWHYRREFPDDTYHRSHRRQSWPRRNYYDGSRGWFDSRNDSSYPEGSYNDGYKGDGRGGYYDRNRSYFDGRGYSDNRSYFDGTGYNRNKSYFDGKGSYYNYNNYNRGDCDNKSDFGSRDRYNYANRSHYEQKDQDSKSCMDGAVSCYNACRNYFDGKGNVNYYDNDNYYNRRNYMDGKSTTYFDGSGYRYRSNDWDSNRNYWGTNRNYWDNNSNRNYYNRGYFDNSRNYFGNRGYYNNDWDYNRNYWDNRRSWDSSNRNYRGNYDNYYDTNRNYWNRNYYDNWWDSNRYWNRSNYDNWDGNRSYGRYDNYWDGNRYGNRSNYDGNWDRNRYGSRRNYDGNWDYNRHFYGDRQWNRYGDGYGSEYYDSNRMYSRSPTYYEGNYWDGARYYDRGSDFDRRNIDRMTSFYDKDGRHDWDYNRYRSNWNRYGYNYWDRQGSNWDRPSSWDRYDSWDRYGSGDRYGSNYWDRDRYGNHFWDRDRQGTYWNRDRYGANSYWGGRYYSRNYWDHDRHGGNYWDGNRSWNRNYWDDYSDRNRWDNDWDRQRYGNRSYWDGDRWDYNRKWDHERDWTKNRHWYKFNGDYYGGNYWDRNRHWNRYDWNRQGGDWNRYGGDWNRYGGDWNRYSGDWNRYSGDWNRYGGDWNRYGGDWNRYGGDWNRYGGDWNRYGGDWDNRDRQWNRNYWDGDRNWNYYGWNRGYNDGNRYSLDMGRRFEYDGDKNYNDYYRNGHQRGYFDGNYSKSLDYNYNKFNYGRVNGNRYYDFYKHNFPESYFDPNYGRDFYDHRHKNMDSASYYNRNYYDKDYYNRRFFEGHDNRYDWRFNRDYHSPDYNRDYYNTCWTFHVWNEVWMARPDLPPGYGGWQVIDATPQEQNDTIVKCGPASIEAIRRGEVGFLYDTPFVFAEVNADLCHYQEDPRSDWGYNRLFLDRYQIGRRIVTKRVDIDDDAGENDLWDITREYKNLEEVDAERFAVYNAVRGVPRTHPTQELPDDCFIQDVEFNLIDIDAVPMGQDFNVLINICNNANEPRTINAMLCVTSVFYHGMTAGNIKRHQHTFTLKPRDKEVLKLHITPTEYLGKLVDHSMMKIYAIGHVKETGQNWSEEDDFTLMKPYHQIHTDQRWMIGQENRAEFSFRNPLNCRLTGCSYTVEGPGLQKTKVNHYREVQPNEVVTFAEGFFPHRAGERRIVANFNCKEIDGINGSLIVLVQ